MRGRHLLGCLGSRQTAHTLYPFVPECLSTFLCYCPPPPHQAFEVFPSDENMHFWKVILTGPASTPYSGGCWLLSIFFPNNYPSIAPKVRFVTPIRHCNINSHGRVSWLGA